MRLKRFLIKFLGLHGQAHVKHDAETVSELDLIEQF